MQLHSQSSGLERGTRLNFCFGLAVLIALVATLFAPEVHASGTGSNDFQGIADRLQGYMSGSFAIAIALLAFILGLFWGVVKQNFILALSGILVAILISVVPSVIQNILGVEIPSDLSTEAIRCATSFDGR